MKRILSLILTVCILSAALSAFPTGSLAISDKSLLSVPLEDVEGAVTVVTDTNGRTYELDGVADPGYFRTLSAARTVSWIRMP